MVYVKNVVIANTADLTSLLSNLTTTMNRALKTTMLKPLFTHLFAVIFAVIFSTMSIAAPAAKTMFNLADFEAIIKQIKSTTGETLTLEQMAEYHIVLVGGFLNEVIPGYFEKTVPWLENRGGAMVSVIMPSSGGTVEDNIVKLHADFKEIHSRSGGRKILAIGHSKGGAELIALIIKYPELMTSNMIRSIITVQAPVAGCFLPTCSEKLLGWAKAIPFISGGFSLTDAEIERLILQPLKALPLDVRNYLSERVFYVVSQQTAFESALAIVGANLVMRQFSESPSNDGLVEEQKMFIKKFGRILGTLQADHMELLVALTLRGLMMGFTTSSKHKNKAFIYLMMKTFLDLMNKQELAQIRACKKLFK